MNALISTDPLRREFLGHERLVNTLYNAVKPNQPVLELGSRVACLAAIAAAIRAKLNPNPATRGQAKWSDGTTFTALKAALDKLKFKHSNTQDALIGEVALKNGMTLVTADEDLEEVMQRLGVNVHRHCPIQPIHLAGRPLGSLSRVKWAA